MATLDNIKNQTAEESRARLDELMGRGSVDDAAITLEQGFKQPPGEKFELPKGLIGEMANLPGETMTPDEQLRFAENIAEGLGAAGGTIAGGPAGGAAGAGLSLGLFRMGQDFGIIPQFQEGPRPTLSQLGKVGTGAVTSLAGDALVGMGVKAATKIKPFASSVSKQAKAAKKLMGKSVQFLPAQMSESQAVEVTQNFFKNAIGSAGDVVAGEQKAIRATDDRIREFARDFTDKVLLRKSRANRIEDIQKIVRNKRDAVNDIVVGKSKIIDGIFGGEAKIDTSTFSSSLLSEDIAPQLIGKKAITFEEAIKIITNPNTSAKTISKLERAMRKSGEGMDRAIKSIVERQTEIEQQRLKFGNTKSAFSEAFKLGAKNRNKAIDEAAKKIVVKNRDMFRNSVEEMIEEIPRFQLYNKAALKKVAADDPSSLAEVLSKKGNEKNINRVKKDFSVDEWDKVEFAFMDDLLRNFSDKASSGDVLTLRANTLGKFIDRKMTIGTFKSMFKSHQKAQAFLNYLDAARVAQKTPSSALGKMMVQMKQAQAITTVGTSILTMSTVGVPMGLAFFGVPMVVGKLFKNEAFLEVLTTGLTIKPGTKEAAAWMSKLGTVAAREGFGVGEVEMEPPKEDASALNRLIDLFGSKAQEVNKLEAQGRDIGIKF